MTSIFSRVLSLLLLVLFLFGQFVSTASALSAQQKQVFQENVNYFDVCGGGSSTVSTAPGTGAPDGAAFPNLDPTAMAQAINTFIQKHSPNSPMKELGTTIVTSAKQANVNPFLVPAIALQETSLGTAGTPQVTEGNDLFNRRATPSQPHISISTGLWYKWSSVKASVDSTAPENQGSASSGGDFLSYLRAQYGDAIDSGDFVHLFSLYDPGFGGPYAATVKGWISEMVKDASSTAASADAANPAGSSQSVSNVYILGDSITQRSQGAYQQAFQQQGITTSIDASSGRSLTGKGTDGNKLSGFDAIDHDKSDIQKADAIVVALGTNGGATARNIDKAIQALQADNTNASIYWVDTFALDRPSYTSSIIKPANQAIYSQASNNQNYQVVSWFKAVYPNGNPQDPSGGEADPNGYIDNSDRLGINPTQKGSDALAKLVSDSISSHTAAANATPASSTQSCCPSGSSGNDASSATTDGTNSAGNEYNFLVGKGVSPKAAAAITGNNIWESGGSQSQLTLNPSSVNSIGATGIAQWYAGRATALHNYAQAQGKPWDDLGLQLDYLWHELQTTESDALKQTEAQPTIDLATTTFERIFEVSGDTSSYPTRISLAKRVLQKFGNGSTVTAQGSISGGGCSSGSSSTSIDGYKNPLRDVKKLRPERIDMGVDYAGEGPVYALGPGTITNLLNSGWDYGGYDAFISEKLSGGPANGRYSYVAEACVPVHGLHVGQQVDANTVICNMINPGDTGIETGWAAPPGLGDTMAISNGGYTEGYATKMGENYNQLLVKLGAPSGTQQPQMGSLPPNWPTW